FSCRSVPTDIAYFQDFDAYVQKNQPGNSAPYEPSIRSNDHLLISVSAPVLDQTRVAQFNLPLNSHLAPGETTVIQSAAVQTYIVDKDGYINFPVLGKLKLAGLTRSQAVELLSQKISDYLPEPIINLQIISFKVTVLGEVLKPGPVVVSDERVTIFDAIGAVGDLTIYGDRQNVILARENNGIKELHKLDLTKTEIFNSPYYYLQQNDVLYVEPNNTKKKESKFGAGENYTLSILSISFTAVSVLVSILGIMSNSKN
ncbi:MAG: polysaccharide biosynthesis/export family protein, partial [Candidatus Symbiothrix sp.]|nr:polysaccharide biosynthesis/export family protein [Candidatus Symbiothrix sp.]